MSQPIEIERAGPQRWALVRALRLAALEDAPDAFWMTLEEERAQPPAHWRERLALADTATLVATVGDGDEPTGAGLAVVAPARDGTDTAGLYAVWVAPWARGRGVGDALVQAAVDHARAGGYARLVLDVGDHNLAAIALYERAGFRPTGRRSRFPPPRDHLTEHERALDLAEPVGR